jgi:23S rRNA pseudouridine1911/1915/1917 synthase
VKEPLKFQWIIPANSLQEPLRADRYIAEVWALLGRSQLKQRLVQLRVNGKNVKISHLLGSGDILDLELKPQAELELSPQAMDLELLFENDDVLVLDKAPGIVVHPAAGNPDGTLVNGLLHYIQGLDDAGFDDEMRPGIVHRLDKETSGVMIVAKNPRAHEFLARQFQDRSTQKVYLAISVGHLPAATFEVRGFLRRDPQHRQKYAWHQSEGKAAATDFRVLSSRGDRHLILAQPFTGRTHQIRVHLAHRGLPIIGDFTYGKAVKGFLADRCMLHAWRLTIVLPGETQAQTFEAPLPKDFCQTLVLGGLEWQGANVKLPGKA